MQDLHRFETRAVDEVSCVFGLVTVVDIEAEGSNWSCSLGCSAGRLSSYWVPHWSTDLVGCGQRGDFHPEKGRAACQACEVGERGDTVHHVAGIVGHLSGCRRIDYLAVAVLQLADRD